jgi:1-acyl-sn-glycerol-3-phosphate acyltransferase
MANRDTLVAAILAFIGSSDDRLTVAEVRSQLEREIDGAGSAALLDLLERLETDSDWAYAPPNPLARRIHHVLAERFLSPDSALLGAEHLDPIASGPVAIFANHLSYADANVMEVMIRRAGCATIADRLTAMAGPKVFTSRARRFSSLCFGTIKVPQSADVASEEAVLDARGAARAARHAIEVAHARLLAGDALVLFGEGTRSRSGGMQPLLTGVARYLDVAETWIVPAGLTGPESLFSVKDSTLRPARVTVHLGQPLRASALLDAAAGNRRVVVDAIGLAIAELLPAHYRGVYGARRDFAEADRALGAVLQQ